MTTWETVIGFVIAAVVGELVAVAMVYSSSLEKTLYPLILFAQVVPKIAIAPPFIVWLGFGPDPQDSGGCADGVLPDRDLRARRPALGGPRDPRADLHHGCQQARRPSLKIRFPASLPQVMSGLKIAATLAVTGAVVGEFVGANEGLG